MNATEQDDKNDVKCDLFLSADDVLTVHMRRDERGCPPEGRTVERLHEMVVNLARAVPLVARQTWADARCTDLWMETSDALATAVTVLAQLAGGCTETMRAAEPDDGVPTPASANPAEGTP